MGALSRSRGRCPGVELFDMKQKIASFDPHTWFQGQVSENAFATAAHIDDALAGIQVAAHVLNPGNGHKGQERDQRHRDGHRKASQPVETDRRRHH